MITSSNNIGRSKAAPFLTRLARDIAGNTLGMLAAGLFPLLALVGGGVDMGRNYLAQSRLQQACDAGVLAARKALGTRVVVDGKVPGEVAMTGNRFFNANFRSGAYGTRDRGFEMTIEPNYAVSGKATVSVPTTIMALFGYDQTNVTVACQAEVSFNNTDIMFVLDTTGSMKEVNPGDSEPKIVLLRQTVKDFYAQLEGTKAPGVRIRYGFLPYATNVNVGSILKPEWVVDQWQYQGRLPYQTGSYTTAPSWRESWNYVSGSDTMGQTTMETSCPADTKSIVTIRSWTSNDGTQNVEYLINGTDYQCFRVEQGNYRVQPHTFNQYRYIYSIRDEGSKTLPIMTWRYQTVPVDVSSLKNGGGLNVGQKVIVPNMGGTPESPTGFESWFVGCIEERDTYEIGDYSNVDFSRALDLDIDLVPSRGNPATQWRPMLNEVSYLRALSGGNGAFQQEPSNFDGDYDNAHIIKRDACPAPARKLATMSAGELSAYVDELYANGNTYHDIGMIWGARMLSPTGIFAAENADVGKVPTSRHMIFLTDGQTAPLDVSYSSYGIEPIDRRRWSPNSSQSLTQVVEGRTAVACEEAKKRNITIWVIGFGTKLNPVLTTCAGPGHSFEADNGAELQAVFSKIASELGNLRVSR